MEAGTMRPRKATFLDLTETVVQDFLLPLLDATDLLRLRHVHPITREWVVTMTNSKVITSIWQKSKEQFVEIDNRKQSLLHLMAMRPPNPLNHSFRFFIKNFKWDPFNDPEFSRFLEMGWHRIRHLHIERYNLCRDPKELEFYNALVNLTRLDIDIVEMKTMTPQHLKNVDAYIPLKTFGKVLELGIGRVTYGKFAPEHLDQRRYIRNHFFPAFTSLQVLKSPKEEFRRDQMIYLRSNPECYCVPFLKIFPFMQAEEICYKSLTTLSVLDMQSVREPFLDTWEFVHLAIASLKCGVELRNLRATYHMIPDADLRSFISKLGPLPRTLAGVPHRTLLVYRVASMFNIVPAMLCYPCPNLRRVSITSCNWCMHNLPIGPLFTPAEFRIEWPKLETLELNINSKVMGKYYFEEEDYDDLDETELFLKYLFMEPNSRSSLETLRLSFLLLPEKTLFPTFTSDIALSCTNLVRLELFGWYGGNESYWPLWKSLTKLEEIIFGKCEGLGDEGFLGPEDKENDNPLFLNLTKLRILVFKAMNEMPGITDVTFTQVIKYLSLTHLQIECDAPLVNITVHGIRSLLEGPFASSIRHFPFSKWSLAIPGFSRKNVHALNSQFRSSQMQTLCDPAEHTQGLFCRNCARLSSLADRHSFERPHKMVSVIVSRVQMEYGKFGSDYDEFKEQQSTIRKSAARLVRTLHPTFRKFLAAVGIFGLLCLVALLFYGITFGPH